MAGLLTVSPLQNPDEYNRIVLAGTSTSGMCLVDVTGAERPFIWDVKGAAGFQGRIITYRGWDLATPKIKFSFWESAQIDWFYSTLAPLIIHDALKLRPKPYDVYHPKLFANQIYWLVTTKLGDLIDEGAQLWTVTAETLEYRKPKPIISNTPEEVRTGKTTVLDEQDLEIQRLDAEFNRPDGSFRPLHRPFTLRRR